MLTVDVLHSYLNLTSSTNNLRDLGVTSQAVREGGTAAYGSHDECV